MNKYNPKIHHRRSIRLKGYNYAQAGLYYITICVNNRTCLFGEIVGPTLVVAQNNMDAQMKLNDAGKMIESEWLKLPNRFQNIQLHEFIIMPNHFHAILEIVGATLVVAPNNVVAQNDNPATHNNDIDLNEGQPQGIAPTGIAPTGFSPTGITNKKTLGDMIGAFESITTVEYIRGVKNDHWKPFNDKLWQRNYWEHIIRNEKSYYNISEYIITNPSKWHEDSLNSNNTEAKK